MAEDTAASPPSGPASRRLVTTAVGKMVAARQAWRCQTCNVVLPSAYEIDHVEPLWRRGGDNIHNLQALCPNCHAIKTQRESVERIEAARTRAKTAQYDTREDKYLSKDAVMCVGCGRVRRVGAPHSICWAIENQPEPDDAVSARLTALFAAPVAGRRTLP